MFQKTQLTIIKEELEALLTNYIGKPATKNNLQFLNDDIYKFLLKHDLADIRVIAMLEHDTVFIKPIRRVDELALISLVPKKFLRRNDHF